MTNPATSSIGEGILSSKPLADAPTAATNHTHRKTIVHSARALETSVITPHPLLTIGTDHFLTAFQPPSMTSGIPRRLWAARSKASPILRTFSPSAHGSGTARNRQEPQGRFHPPLSSAS